MEIDFKHVEVNHILKLRHKVLRPNKSYSSACFIGDDFQSTIHLAAFYNSKVLGCVSLMLNNSPHFKEKQTYQLRGMAVDKNYRGLKIGQRLLKFAELQLKRKQVHMVWCNVRTTAAMFYTKNGFNEIGDVFNIPEVGPHILMYKQLNDA